MRQAIQTRFLPPTNHRPSRVTAWAEAGRVTVSWDHGGNVDDNHRQAAEALAERLGWTGERYGPLVGGALPGRGYAFVFRDHGE